MRALCPLTVDDFGQQVHNVTPPRIGDAFEPHFIRGSCPEDKIRVKISISDRNSHKCNDLIPNTCFSQGKKGSKGASPMIRIASRYAVRCVV